MSARTTPCCCARAASCKISQCESCSIRGYSGVARVSRRGQRRASRSRRAQHAGGAREGAALPHAARSRRRWLVAAGAVVLLIAAVVLTVTRSRGRPLPSFPPADATYTMIADTPRFDDFAGADACAGCHEAQYRAWRGSTHGRAGGSPPEHRPLRPFTGDSIRFADAIVLPEQLPGALRFRVRRSGSAESSYDVVAIVGGAHLAGGGTQAYFMRHVDGSV